MSSWLITPESRFGGGGATDTYEKAQSIALTVASDLSKGQFIVELLRPGLFALVGMFFALSGYLVVASAVRTKSTGKFFRNRVMRIVPALSVEVTLSALVLGPLVTTLPLGEYFTNWEFFRYFGNIVGHTYFDLPGVFKDNPWPSTVNASLWTLQPEFYCYAIMLVFLLFGMRKNLSLFNAGTILSIIIVCVIYYYDPVTFNPRHDTSHFTWWYIVALFFMGAFLYIHGDKIPFGFPYFLLAGALYYVLMLIDAFSPLVGLPLAYCTAYIGLTTFGWFDRLVKVDVSYGMYLYAFPITQGVVFAMGPTFANFRRAGAFLVVFPIIFLATTIFAYLSWTYIEKPFLNLRHRFDAVAQKRALQAAN